MSPARCGSIGNKIGLVSDPLQFTYQEFAERCGRLATGLAREGDRAGDRVAYLSFNTNQLLEGYYGVVQARAIVMPLNVRLSPVELISILNHSGARMLLFENDFAPLVEKLRKACPAIQRYVTLDEKVAVADLTAWNCWTAGTPSARIFSPTTRTPSRSCSTPAAAPARPRA